MEQSERGTLNTPAGMPLNAGEPGYGAARGVGLSPGLSPGGDASESAPLLVSDTEEPDRRWQPLSMEELELAAGGPGWRRVRCYLVLLFWLAWGAMLAASIAIVVMSPRPVAPPLGWWQKSLFCQLQAEGAGGISVVYEQVPYLKSLGVGALILQGLFDKELSPSNSTATSKHLVTLTQIQHLLAESNKIGLKVLLDICKLDLASDRSTSAHQVLQFWLEQGAAGFAICDTDAAYAEKTLLEWRGVFKEFSSQGEERILVVRQERRVLSPLNVTLVDVVMKSILPSLPHPPSASEVADAIETLLQAREGNIWPSWTVGGKAPDELKGLLLVLTMTLPGSPAIQYEEDIIQMQNVSRKLGWLHGETNTSDTHTDQDKMKRTAMALFTSLSHSRAREEALLYGSFTFLPFNSSTNSSSNFTLASPPSPPMLAFLRSWGCVHFLVLLNVGPDLHALDPAWAPSLPEGGVFVASTGMDRLGSTTLNALELRPHEAVVIKLFKAGSYS